MSFVERRISLRFQLGTGAFGEDGSNVVDLSGLRCSAEITKAGGTATSSLDLRVWGLALDVMSKLTIINQISQESARLNTVIVEAGDDENGMAVCFAGQITEAWGDFHAMPDVAFHLTANNGYFDAVRPIPPTTFNGTADVATVLSGICAQMLPPRTLQNSGVNIRLTDPYLPGTALDQIKAIATHANIQYALDDDNTLAIWPSGGSRGARKVGQIAPNGTAIPLISPETGLVGYPDFTSVSIRAKSLYNPSLTIGQTVEIKSEISAASKQVVIASMGHSLDAQVPGGAWFTQIECGIPGLEAPIVN